jgi:hypothetical protein
MHTAEPQACVVELLPVHGQPTAADSHVRVSVWVPHMPHVALQVLYVYALQVPLRIEICISKFMVMIIYIMFFLWLKIIFI